MKTYKYAHVVWWEATGSTETKYSDSLDWKQVLLDEGIPSKVIESGFTLYVTYELKVQYKLEE
jgi:hypothetical protein